jgi:hypothetical protein
MRSRGEYRGRSYRSPPVLDVLVLGLPARPDQRIFVAIGYE